MREGRTGRPLSVMPDGCYRASSILSLPIILPPWIPVEDGFPLKTCGNDRRGACGNDADGTASLSVMPACVSVIPLPVVVILALPIVILNDVKNLASRWPGQDAAGVWASGASAGLPFPHPGPLPEGEREQGRVSRGLFRMAFVLATGH